jgi:hypothetical protein
MFPAGRSLVNKVNSLLLIAGFRDRKSGVDRVARGLAVTRIGAGIAVPAGLARVGVTEPPLDLVVGQACIAEQ